MREGLIDDLRTTADQLQHGAPLPYRGLLLEAADVIAFLANVVLQVPPSAPPDSPPAPAKSSTPKKSSKPGA